MSVQIHFDNVPDLAGIALTNALNGEPVKVLTRAMLTSDDPEFYQFSEHLADIFLANISPKNSISINSTYQFLIIIHQNLSADLYVNDFHVSIEIKAKKDIGLGEFVMREDIADIYKLRFPDIEIVDTDKVICCFKVDWRFGLFFDFTSQIRTNKKLDIEKVYLDLGKLYRYLSFYHVYKVCESQVQFGKMTQGGWFPFIEIIAKEYKLLSAAYQNNFDLENRIKTIVDGFDKTRIKKITEKWWKNQFFSDKKSLIEAGISAYLQNNHDGFINCIKNLGTEIEGILRKVYQSETGKGDNVKSPELIAHLIEKAKNKSGSDDSLFFSTYFLTYLQNVVFAKFNMETGKINMSRNASSHGVAEPDQYTKEKALQLILILDQIYFYI